METKFEVKLLNENTIDDQVEAYCRSFDNTRSHMAVKDYWIKKHFNNPIHKSYIFGVFDGKRLVSINAYMPLKYRLGKKDCMAIQSCESGTIPEYRGKGIWSMVVSYAVAYFKKEGVYDLLLGFPNYSNSYGGFMKMQWNHDMDIENYIMIGNGKIFVSSALGGKRIPIAAVLGVQHIKIKLKKNNKLTVCECRTNTSEINEVGDAFMLMKSDAFLKWKCDYKGLQQFGLCDSDKNYLATCSYAVGNYKNTPVINLYSIEIMKKVINSETIYASCITEILNRYPDIAYIRTWVMKESSRLKVYKKLLFLKSKHHNPFITYQLKNDIVTAEQIKDKNKWVNLSFMDLD